MKDKLANLQEEAAKNLDGWKRALADYDNLKRQSEETARSKALNAQVEMILEIAPKVEHLKVAASHIPEDQSNQQWAIGLQHIISQFEELLTNFGVKTIDPQPGEDFDHNLHEAVETSDEGDMEENKIIKTLSPGYLLKEKLVKPAQVIVHS